MIRIVVGIVVLYLLAVGYLYFTQEAQIFPRKYAQKEELLQNEKVKALTLEVHNALLKGAVKADDDPNAPLILYFGGNAEDATHFIKTSFTLPGYDVMVFNYRGYGESSGEPSQEALFEDALKIYDTYAKGRRVFLIGRSLGTGVATFLASKRVVDGLILVTPYDSILSLAERKFWMFPVSYLLKHPFESTKYIANVTAPIIVMDAENDEIIPKDSTDALIEAMPVMPQRVSFKNTTHNTILGHPYFMQELQTLLGQISE